MGKKKDEPLSRAPQLGSITGGGVANIVGGKENMGMDMTATATRKLVEDDSDDDDDVPPLMAN